MNKERRKELAAIMDRLETLSAQVLAVKSEAESIRDDLQSITDEEQDAFDSMPESLQEGERGQTMQDGLSKLEDALSTIGELAEIEDDFSDMLSAIDDARGQA